MISVGIYLSKFLTQRRVLKPRTKLVRYFIRFPMTEGREFQTMVNNEDSVWEEGKDIKYVEYFEDCFFVMPKQECKYE